MRRSWKAFSWRPANYLTLLVNSWWGVLLLVPLMLLLHFGVVRREERYLQRKFGDEYTEYRSQVRRYV